MSSTITSAATATASALSSNGDTRPGGIWPYTPNTTVAAIATILYAIVTLWLIGRLFQKRAWSMTALVIGSLMETVGFAARTKGSKDLTQVGAYKIQLALLILAPIFTQAGEYIILGRLMGYVGRRFSLLRPSLIATIFVMSDVISFGIQVGGAVIIIQNSNLSTDTTQQEITNNENELKVGSNVLIAGLSINTASFIIFYIQISYFHYRTIKGHAASGKWQTLLYALYLSSTLVLIRMIYRIIQFSEGWFGYLNTHEVYFYVFDSLMIWIATAIYCWWFPHKYVPRDGQLRLADDGTEWREMTRKEKRRLEAEGQVLQPINPV